MAGCTTLPAEKRGPPSTGLPAGHATTLGRLAASLSTDPDLSGFRLLPSGDFALDARLQLVRHAEQSLDIQYYQIADDETGRFLLRTLRDAARRGVRVRLLIDDLYTAGADELLLGLAAEPMVELRLFNPFPGGRDRLGTRLLASGFELDRVQRRMHNKLFIADGAMAVAGGRNIGNQYFQRTAGENFIDLDTFVVGAILPRLASLFDRYWNSDYVWPVQAVAVSPLSAQQLRQRFDEATGPAHAPPPPAPAPNDVLGYAPIGDELAEGRLGLIWARAEGWADTPERVIGKTTSYGGVALLDVDSVRYNVVEQMRRASSEVVIASPYLIPGDAGLDVLGAIRRRGADITIVTNSLAATDEPLVHTGYRRYRREMLTLGVHLYELSSDRARRSVRLGLFNTTIGRLHMKTAVIDRRTLFVGSMNFDPRSKSFNTEIGLIVFSPGLAGQVLKLIDVVKQQGAYRLRLSADGSRLEWLSSDDEAATVLFDEPDSTLWDRLLLELLAPLTPESLL